MSLTKPNRLPENTYLELILSQFANGSDPRVQKHALAQLKFRDQNYTQHALSIGTQKPDVPVLVMIGGIHGLERIGSHVVLAFLQSLLSRLGWSESLQRQLQNLRMIFVPIANPVGMARDSRSNGNGVDLMRNAPIESREAIPFFGGQRWSSKMPFYRGIEGSPMEPELQAIENFIHRQTQHSPATFLLDVHSGFGGIDRVWFPHAMDRRPFPHLPEIVALIQNFESAFPNHSYRFEPQSTSYCTHGDFWDYLYEKFYQDAANQNRLFMPLTLEMGSWLWIKKNPTQLLSFLGAFDPIKPHRRKRVLRRHLPFLDFLRDAAESHDRWLAGNTEQRERQRAIGLARWYTAQTKS